MSLSLREISSQQFADGTTIDGVRVDRAMGDFVSLWNDIPKRLIDGVCREYQVVGGMLPWGGALTPVPMTPSVDNTLPWMRAYNSPQPMEMVGTAPDAGVVNEWRAKGFSVRGIDPTNNVTSQSVLLWTQNFWFSRPVILQGVWLSLCTDEYFPNNFQYAAPPPPGSSAGDRVEDLFLEFAVKNQFLSGVRRLDDSEWRRCRFDVSGCLDSHSPIFATVADLGWPAHPVGFPGRQIIGGDQAPSPWVVVDLRHLNIPVPAGSRCRFSIGIPAYDTYQSGWGLGGYSFLQQYSSWSLSFMEEVV